MGDLKGEIIDKLNQYKGVEMLGLLVIIYLFVEIMYFKNGVVGKKIVY